MKLHLLDRASVKNKSFTVSINCYPHFLKIWHHHQELELVVIKKVRVLDSLGGIVLKNLKRERSF